MDVMKGMHAVSLEKTVVAFAVRGKAVITIVDCACGWQFIYTKIVIQYTRYLV